MFDLIFTITDQPPVEDLGIELPIEAVRNLTECQRLLQDAVTAGTFVINVSLGGRVLCLCILSMCVDP